GPKLRIRGRVRLTSAPSALRRLGWRASGDNCSHVWNAPGTSMVHQESPSRDDQRASGTIQDTARTLSRGDGAGPRPMLRLRSSCAFAATTMVETLIRMAPTAGARVSPAHAKTPAATGMANVL